MSDRIDAAEIVAAIRAATNDVFSTMLNLPIEAGRPSEETDEPESFDGVISMVGIAGDWTGSGRVSCSPHFACKLAEALLMTPYEAVNEGVLDAMSEVGNMIIGNIKSTFEEKLGPLGLSVPTVIFGRNYRTRSASVLKWTLVPFRCGDERMDVSFCLMKSRASHAHNSAGSLSDALQVV
jgi:chemotaxis protein CheX